MDSLKKELEEELKLSTEDPRSHAWYHGPLSREVLNRPYYSRCIYTKYIKNILYRIFLKNTV